MIKVMQLVPTMSTGGAETLVKDYALLIDSKQFEVQVVVLDHHYDSLNEKLLEENNIKTTYLGEVLYGERTDLNLLQKIKKRLYRYYYLRKLVMQEKPDIIHVHLVLDKYLHFLPIKKQNIALIYTVHNVVENYFCKDKKNKRKYKEYKECQRLIDKYDMTLIALHDFMNRQLRDFFHTDKVVTVNNGVQVEKFSRKLFNREKIRSDLGFELSDFVVGNIGRMHPQKNHDLILDIFMKVLETKNNAKLLLVGKGEREEYVRSKVRELQIQDKVVMLKNRPDIPELMSAMDVFLLPSLYEGFPVALVEAQAAGLPCVVSDTITKESVLTKQVQMIGLDESVWKWADAICNANYSETAADEMADYDIKNCIKKLENVYWQSVHKHPDF